MQINKEQMDALEPYLGLKKSEIAQLVTLLLMEEKISETLSRFRQTRGVTCPLVLGKTGGGEQQGSLEANETYRES